MTGLSGSSYLVVGATGGMGQAVARRLAADGATAIALAARRPAAAGALADELSGQGVTVSVHACDLTEPGQPQTCVDEVIAAHGVVDGLVVCAGDPPWGGLWDVDDADWQRSIDTMLLGHIRTMRAALPGMLDRGSGRVVLVGGLNGRKPNPGSVIAGVVCAGLANIVTAMAQHTIISGVTVNLVDPHLTDTPRWQRQIDFLAERRGVAREEAAATVLAQVPTQAPLAAEDIAGAVRFLLSDDAANVNGVALPVDRGTAGHIY